MLVENANKVAPGPGVTGAIRDAAQATGTSFDYLLTTARVESGLDPNAGASTSSARGLFQFIEQTWLATLKAVGSALGYGQYADAIVQTPSGRYEVPDPSMRQQVMSLRDDPAASATMAGAFTRRNAEQVAGRIGREPTEGELYIAHFLGAAGAANLINLVAATPAASAADAFPGAAQANRSIFYDRDGRPRSVSEVYGLLVGRYASARGGADPAGTAAVAPASFLASTMTQPPTPPTPLTPDTRPVFHSLFRNDGAPVSHVVQELWSTRPRVAAALLAAPPPADPPARTPTGGTLDLFQDHPAQARGLFDGK
jgi:hypothetical protein